MLRAPLLLVVRPLFKAHRESDSADPPLADPEENKRGRYLSYWLAWRNGGQILGGAISLGLNAKGNKIGAIGRETYYVFIALQAFAPFVAVLLSSAYFATPRLALGLTGIASPRTDPPQVQRKDRTPVKMENHIGLKAELKEVWDTLTRREVLWLCVTSYAPALFSR